MYWFLIHQLPFPVPIKSYTGRRLHACNEEMIHSDVHICRCFNWLIRFKLDVKKKIQADLFLNYTYYEIFKLTTIFYSWYVVIIFFKYILTIFDKNTHIWLSEKCNQNWWKGKIFKIFNWHVTIFHVEKFTRTKTDFIIIEIYDVSIFPSYIANHSEVTWNIYLTQFFDVIIQVLSHVSCFRPLRCKIPKDLLS